LRLLLDGGEDGAETGRQGGAGGGAGREECLEQLESAAERRGGLQEGSRKCLGMVRESVLVEGAAERRGGLLGRALAVLVAQRNHTGELLGRAEA